MSITTKNLASFCVNFKTRNLTRALIEKTKTVILDYLGVALGGSTKDSSGMIASFVKEMGGSEDSTLIGFGGKVPSPNAALANGTMTHTLELDDTHDASSTHPCAPVVSASLAVGEKENVDGKTFITSVVLGYEVMTRIGIALNPAMHYMRGFHPTGTCGPFATAAAAGKILGLDEKQMSSAFGIAGSQAGGLKEFLTEGTWTKRLHAGLAARSGVTSALLAQRGYTGPSTVIEGENGFLRAYSSEYDVSKLTDGLGREFAIMGTSLKPYACGKYLHASIEATIELAKEYDLRPENVKEITVNLSPVAMSNVITEPEHEIRRVVDAQFSIPYSVAVSLVKRRAFIDEYSEKGIKDEVVLKLAKRVRVVPEPRFEEIFQTAFPAKVTIQTVDGKTYEKLVSVIKGDPEKPLSQTELEEKFRTLASMAISEEKMSKIIGVVRALERLKDIKELTELLY